MADSDFHHLGAVAPPQELLGSNPYVDSTVAWSHFPPVVRFFPLGVNDLYKTNGLFVHRKHPLNSPGHVSCQLFFPIPFVGIRGYDVVERVPMPQDWGIGDRCVTEFQQTSHRCVTVPLPFFVNQAKDQGRIDLSDSSPMEAQANRDAEQTQRSPDESWLSSQPASMNKVLSQALF